VWERLRAPACLRLATHADVPRLREIRSAVRENRLPHPDVVPAAEYYAAIDRGVCWVWADAAGVHGFAAGHPSGGAEVWAVFVDPAAEGRGAGSALLAQITDVLWSLGHRRLTLGTQPGSRAERIYRAAGWLPVGRAPTATCASCASSEAAPTRGAVGERRTGSPERPQRGRGCTVSGYIRVCRPGLLHPVRAECGDRASPPCTASTSAAPHKRGTPRG
jgi:GNAT superfamily N-acetyltransferase